MAESVMNKVLEKCRTALLGGTPILYIKTDSDVFIQNLLLDENAPLFVLLSNGGNKATTARYGLQRARPIYELENEEDKRLEFCLNYTANIPVNFKGRYIQLVPPELPAPHLWVKKMDSDQASSTLDTNFTNLEKYIADRENPRYPEYPLLQSSVVILYSSTVKLSPMLRTYTEIIEVDYPDEKEIEELVKTLVAGNPMLTENEANLSTLCANFLGFTTEEITVSMRKIIATQSFDEFDKVKAQIQNYKKQKLEGGLLEHCSTEGHIGGMDNFKNWLEKQKAPLCDHIRYKDAVGTLPPKGVLLCGIPGCGKSEAARFTAKALNLPLIKMDIGSLMDKYVGGSEQKMRDALHMAKAMSPCVLWIDEIDKGFSGAGGHGEDSSSFKRMFGYMLSWMQDNKEPCFIFATANDIGSLPKEFFRSGRFDALFSVYLPTSRECASIFKSCMKSSEAIRENTDILFDDSCYDDNLYIDLLDRYLLPSNGRPRMIIGSDIRKIVTLALQSFIPRSSEDKHLLIYGYAWKAALEEVLSDSMLSLYGDGEENIDSIAIAYCRMLRKKFLPTAKYVLFENNDYQIDRLNQYVQLKNKDTSNMTEEEKAEHQRNLEESAILKNSKKNFPFDSRYDEAVYTYLYERINELAVNLESYERNRMLGR